MTDDEERKRSIEVEKRLTAIEKENEHLKERIKVLGEAVNNHRHERHERPLFDYV